MKPIEEHLADFLMANPGPAFLSYRRKCLDLWREKYGAAVVARVENLVAKRWQKK